MGIEECRRDVRASVGTQGEGRGVPALHPAHPPCRVPGTADGPGAACGPRECRVQRCGGAMQDHRLVSLPPLR